MDQQYEYWVTEIAVGLASTNEQMRWLNELSQETPEWELVTCTPQGRYILRKPR